MAAIAQLKAMLGLDTKEFRAGMKSAQGMAQSFGQQLSGIGRILGVAFSAAGIIQATRSVINFASEIRHTADNLNVTTDELQALNAVALRHGVEIDQVSRALAKMIVAQDGVVKGEKKYVDVLRVLNIDAAKFVNMDSAQAFAELGRAAEQSENKTAAFAAIMDLIGQRLGPRLVAMMKSLGNDGLQTVIDQAKEAGRVIEDDLITRLELLGTRNKEIVLRMKVGWAELLDTIGKAAKAIGAQAGVASVERKQKPLPLWKAMASATPLGALTVWMERMKSKEAVAAGAEAIGGTQIDKGATAGAAAALVDPFAEANRKMEEENEKLRVGYLKGMDRLKEETDTQEKELTRLITLAQKDRNAEGERLLRERLAIVKQHYQDEIKAAADAERKKREDIIREHDERVAELLARDEDARRVVPGGGSRGGMSGAGAAYGGERNLEIPSKQLQAALDLLRVQKEIERLTNDMNTKLAELNDKTGGGAP